MMKRRLVAAGATLFLAFGINGLTATGAYAGGYNWVPLPMHNVTVGKSTWKVPGGGLDVTVNGSGYDYKKWTGSAASVQLCYPRVDLLTRGYQSALLTRLKGVEYNGCVNWERRNSRENGQFASNTRQACSEYYGNGNYKAQACVYVHA